MKKYEINAIEDELREFLNSLFYDRETDRSDLDDETFFKMLSAVCSAISPYLEIANTLAEENKRDHFA